jgi:putative inorganic carbon (HCO3(-)) transporter
MPSASPAPPVEGPHSRTPVRRVPRRSRLPASGIRGRWLALAEVAVVALAAPVLLFPNRLLPVAAPLLPAAWLLRRWRVGGLVRMRQDGPIAALLAMTIVALFASFDLGYSLPKLCGILLGVAAFYAVASIDPGEGARRAVVGVLLGSTAAVIVVGLVGTAWFQQKVFGVGVLTAHLPSLADRLPRSVLAPGQAGIHPNELAGTLVLLLPAPAALLLAAPRATSRGLRAAYALACGAGFATLLLTQSRGAWVGAAAALGCLGVGWLGRRRGRPRWGWLVGAAGLGIGALAAFTWRLGGPAELLVLLDRWFGETSSGVSRIELWGRVWLMVQDFPFTGVGLNAFPFVLDAFYPTFLSAPGELIPHAHDVYLQVAMDLGVPGLAAFLALLFAAARSWAAARRAPRSWRALADGSALGLLGFCVYGLTDAIALGAKPGVFLWFLLGVIVLAERSARPLSVPAPGPPSARR